MASVVAGCGSSGPAPIDVAQARTQIQHAYETLFNLADKSVEPKLAVVQDGASLRQAMQEALASSLANSASGASVHQITVLGSTACSQAAEISPCARVTYDILSTTGAPLESGSKGYAVLVDQKWLVAKHTVCGLFELLYTTEGKSGSPPGC